MIQKARHTNKARKAHDTHRVHAAPQASETHKAHRAYGSHKASQPGKAHTSNTANKKRKTVPSSSKRANRSAHAPSSGGGLSYLPQRAVYDLAIIGGGASGLTAAIAAAQEAHRQNRSLRIVVLEQNRRIGTSIMRSGNGRCNFSHTDVEAAQFHNAAFVQQAFDALESTDCLPSVLSWFDDVGLVYDELPGSHGMLFPLSRKANSVLDVLRRALEENHVEVRTGTKVVDLKRLDTACSEAGAQYALDILDDSLAGTIRARAVVFAAGGGCAEAITPTLRPVLPLVPCVPVLGSLALRVSPALAWSRLNGIRMAARVSVPQRDFSEEGEVLFRDYGISGIVVFNASRFAHPGDELMLDLIPSMQESDLVALLGQRVQRFATRNALALFEGFLLPAVAETVVRVTGVSLREPLSVDATAQVAHTLKSFSVEVEGLAEPRSAQVQRGGCAVEAFDPATLEAYKAPGLYGTGEALDVDGPCGGYNLHWAWTSGLLAGHHAAQRVIANEPEQSERSVPFEDTAHQSQRKAHGKELAKHD